MYIKNIQNIENTQQQHESLPTPFEKTPAIPVC